VDAQFARHFCGGVHGQRTAHTIGLFYRDVKRSSEGRKWTASLLMCEVFSVAGSGPRSGDTTKQFRNVRVQRSGNRLNTSQSQIAFATLNRTDVGVVQAADIGQLLLRPALSFSKLTDSCTQPPLNPLHPKDDRDTLLLRPETLSRILGPLARSGSCWSQGAEVNAETPERYSFEGRDRALLTAAAVLLKKVAAAETLRPGQLVSVAKLRHVLSHLPRVTPDLDVTVSVISPRRKFGEVETWHYWDIAIEEEQLSISSGGHFYQPSTGGDSFTTLNWSAVPEEPAVFEDYRETLWMVPDVQSFPEAVESIDFAAGAYRIEITDSDNALLGEDEDS